jgi:hypothetical protein
MQFNHRRQRTPRGRALCISRQWRGAAAAERWARILHWVATCILLLVFLGTLKAKGDEFWNGAVSYSPPFRMSTNSQLEAGGDSLQGWEFRSWDGNSKVVFSVGSLSTPNDPEGPSHPIRTILDLKEFLDSRHKVHPRGSNTYSTKLIKLAGREAVSCAVSADNKSYDSEKWFYSVCFFWEQRSAWQKTTICDVIVTANNEQTLGILTNSLNTIRINPARLKK